MADNIIIKITGESDFSDVTKDFEGLKKKEAEIVSGMDAIKKKQEEFAGAPKVIKLLDEEYKKLDKDLKATKTSLTDLNSKLGNVNDTVAKGATQAPRFVTQLRAMKQELAAMEMAGQSNSKAFVDLSVKAGQLEDQVGDTRKQIQILSSDTRGLDTAMGVGQGLAGAFTAATSAAALLGGENEDLQKAFFKVQAVMSILNGVNEVALMLNKDSVVMVNLRTAAEQSNTLAKVKNWAAQTTANATTAVATGLESKNIVVKGASTAAQWLLNTAVLAFPAVAIIAAMAAVVAAFAAFSNASRDAAVQQVRLNNQNQQFNEDMNERDRLTSNNIELMKAQGKTINEIRAYEKQRSAENIAYAQQELNFLQSREDATPEQLESAGKLLQRYRTEQLQLNHRYRVEDAQAATDAAKAERDRLQKIADDKLKAKEEENKRLLEENRKFLKQIAEDEYEQTSKNQKIQKQVITSGIVDLTTAKVATTASEGKRMIAVTNKTIETEKENTIKANQEAADKKAEITSAAFDLGNQLASTAFSFAKEKQAQELADLEHFYTTDAQAAAENSNLKLISEKELAKRKLEVRKKQAILDREEAIFNIAMNTAQNIVMTVAKSPWLVPFIVGMGIAQTAAVLSKPLPAYAKGRKGGKGETALVGERGPEIMYVPDGASIIPAHLSKSLSFNTMQEYGMLGGSGLSIDYNRLGKAVADNVRIPSQKAVNVTVDRNGILVTDGGRTTQYLQSKYSAKWS